MAKEDFSWKRIQTLIIGIAAALLVSMLAMDMCYTMVPKAGAAGVMERFSIQFTERYQFMIFSFTTFALCIVAIGYYKQRIIQMRLCILNSIMLLFYQLWILGEFFFRSFNGVAMRQEFTLGIASLFPIIAIILLLVAARFIGRDEIRFTVANAMAAKRKK